MMKSVPIEKIQLGIRARCEYRNIDELAESFKNHGVLQPIVITEDFKLIAGGRRLRAAEMAGLDKIPAVLRKDVDDVTLRELELEENLQREDLTWVEEVNAKKELDSLKRKKHGDGARSSEGWTLADTAQALGESSGGVSQDIALADILEKIPQLKQAKNKTEARKLFKQFCEKAAIKHVVGKAKETMTNPAFRLANNHYQIGDALEGLKGLESNGPIKFIEVDPPYAVDFKTLREKHREGESGSTVQEYNEVDIREYPEFLLYVLKECYRVAGPHCFAVVWHASTLYSLVLDCIKAAGWKVDAVPCIWYKETPGVSMKPDRLLARSYEPFFIAWKGAPVLLKQGRANVFSYKIDTHPHPTAKPLELMEELINIFCPPASVGLVPFLGSGRTLRALYRTRSTGFGWDLSEGYKDKFLMEVLDDKREMQENATKT